MRTLWRKRMVPSGSVMDNLISDAEFEAER